MFAEFAAIFRKYLFGGPEASCGDPPKHGYGVLAVSSPSTRTITDRTDFGRLIVTLLFWGALSFYLYAFVGIYIDDSYITLSYVKTLVETGVWGMHAQLPSNSATSPLNVLLLAALTKVSHDPALSVYAFTVGMAAVIFLSLRYYSRLIFDNDLFAYGATALLFSNPLLISTLGLECFLAIALIVAACVLFHQQRFCLLGLTVGLLIMARPDGLILAAIFAVLLIRSWRPLFSYGGMVLATIAPWYFFAWYHLGSLLPDTLFIKVAQSNWGGFDYRDGLALYLKRYPQETLVSLSPCFVLVPLLYVVRRSQPATLLGVCLLATTILQFLAYGILRVPPYHWYYTWIAASGAILGSLTLMLWCKSCRLSSTLVAAISLAGVALSLNAVVQCREVPIHSNWATVAQYRAIAAWINDNYKDEQFDISGELGVVQYFTKANATNEFSDRLWLTRYLRALDRQDPFHRIMAVNFHHANIPTNDKPGYRLTTRCEGTDGTLKKWVVRSRWRSRTTYCFREMAN